MMHARREVVTSRRRCVSSLPSANSGTDPACSSPMRDRSAMTLIRPRRTEELPMDPSYKVH
jgi:hypothetical protein